MQPRASFPAALGTSLALLIAGCAGGPGNEYESVDPNAASNPGVASSPLAQDCSIFRERMDVINNWVPTSLGAKASDWKYPAGLLGSQSREVLRADMEVFFPPIAIFADYDEEGQRREGMGYFNRNGLSLGLLVYGVSGTALSFSPTEAERVRVEIDDNSARKVINNGLLETLGIGPIKDRDNRTLCFSVDTEMAPKGDPLYAYETDTAWRQAEGKLWDMAEIYHDIRLCQVDGKVFGGECSEADRDDFERSTESVTIEPRNPFLEPFSDRTTQGLAEFSWCWNLGSEVNAGRTGCN